MTEPEVEGTKADAADVVDLQPANAEPVDQEPVAEAGRSPSRAS